MTARAPERPGKPPRPPTEVRIVLVPRPDPERRRRLVELLADVLDRLDPG